MMPPPTAFDSHQGRISAMPMSTQASLSQSQHGQAAGGAADGSVSLVTAVGGTATAVGNTTAATGSVETGAHDNGHASVAMGNASFQATAESTSGTPSAQAATYLDVSGADVLVIHQSQGSTQQSSDASAGAVLHFVAIANGSHDPHGPVVIDVQQPWHDQPGGLDAVGGNFAQVWATADAHGSHTAAITFSDATTAENQFSFVQAAALVAV